MSALPADLQRRCDALRADFDEHEARKQPWPTNETGAFAERVLPLELRRLRGLYGQPSGPNLLVLLCGTSPQPLLVSLGHLRPARVLVVGSDSDDGRRAVDDFLEAAGHPAIADRVTADLSLEPVRIAGADPARAYAELLAGLRPHVDDDTEDVLIDVTGGKKTMVAAAYLVASHLGLRTVYVDAEYSPTLRIPRPFTAAVRRLDDPVVVFRIREIDRARDLFRTGRYGRAAELLREAADALEGLDLGGAPVPHDPAAVRRFAAACGALESWRAAAYEQAESTLADADLDVPPALADLASRWAVDPGGGTVGKRRLRSFATRDRGEPLLRFAADRVAWALRAWRRDDRSPTPLLGVYSGCETALDGLVCALLSDGRWVVEGAPKAKGWQDVERALPRGGRALAEALGTGKSREGLRIATNVPALGEPLAVMLGPVRAHRNDLVHQVDGLEPALAATFLDGERPACLALLEAVGLALGLDEGTVSSVLLEATDDGALDRLGPTQTMGA